MKIEDMGLTKVSLFLLEVAEKTQKPFIRGY